MERIKAMKRTWKIGMTVGAVVCMMLSSCYDKIDDFDILSDTEYSIERGTDTLFKSEEFVWMPDIRFPPFATKRPDPAKAIAGQRSSAGKRTPS